MQLFEQGARSPRQPTDQSDGEIVTVAVDKNQDSSRPKSKWKFHLRPEDDDEEQDWWWASTAIPLLAATTGPLANVLSIAALVTSWRCTYDPASPGVEADAIGFPDPRWCLVLNGASLACGFAGNIFLLFNFTRRVRYIVALPMTIVLWYFATGILIGITVSMHVYAPPRGPDQLYSQGYWHAVIAAILYMISSMVLMLNMLGYVLGHYPQHFELSDEQRNLILQTMMFFIWLAGGAAVFVKVEGWSFVDALYYCDVTVLTIGYGDFHPVNNTGRGLVIPYSVGGIIILGLMVSSIHTFARQLGSTHVVQGHTEKRRTKTVNQHRRSSVDQLRGSRRLRRNKEVNRLREEKDRFDAMRAIQQSTSRFKRYTALTMSFVAFGLLWGVGAVGFWKVEHHTQGLSYFQALYFAWVSLTTIGYGDESPSSNAGKPLFIVWSLIAVPTMTILVSDMGDTVVASFKRAVFVLADWTVLPKAGVWRTFCQAHPKLTHRLQHRRKQETRPTLEEVVQLDELDDHALARRLATAIRRTANHLRQEPDKSYSYEEWAEYRRLIQFSRSENEDLIEWDWIGEDSPLVADQSESEWVLDRLTESLDRYLSCSNDKPG